jgi:UDP-N-acetylmuramyl pentapeptide phosphotransferase/UDP-N-acetylglucosamine-1-phosphate transferase
MGDDGKALICLGERGLAFFFAAAVISFGLLLCLTPFLGRYTLAKPNARSSHKEPTPQGGGIAVIAATTIVVGAGSLFLPIETSLLFQLIVVCASALVLAMVGIADDVRPLNAMPRLLLQTAAVSAVLAALPAELRVLPVIPWWTERLLLLVATVWFVNLVNFMDGIDWMTVAELVPATAALALFGFIGAVPWNATLVALALCGAVVGFAPFNRPVARLFLGDVGSLPIGLLLGWLLILLAGNGHLGAALLLPLYYLADATITLLRRLAKGEKLTKAHRSHFYQRATDNGLSVYQIVGRVFALNIVLAALAAVTLSNSSVIFHTAVVLVGSALVALTLWDFGRVHSKSRL